MGKRKYTCTPWGMPTYNIFGWQKPCYLLSDGYVDTFGELMNLTEWERYGTESGNPKCRNCMVHSGYEASAVNDTFSLKGIFKAARATFVRRHLRQLRSGQGAEASPNGHAGAAGAVDCESGEEGTGISEIAQGECKV